MARSMTDDVRSGSETSTCAERSDYKSVALKAAWGAEGTGEADFGPAWKFLSADPQAINEQDEQGRTILHCCCALPDDAGRATLLNNLLAAGADPRIADKYGWSPADSDFMLDAEDKWLAWRRRFTDKDLKFLLERGTSKLTEVRVQQALWICCSRHNVNVRLETRGKAKGQTPLHLIAQCIPTHTPSLQDQEEDSTGTVHVQQLQPLTQAMAKERLDKWSAKKALLQMRHQLEKKGARVEEWTPIHDLLCLVLDLGANAELLDGDERKASHYSASESVRALLESDWELGEKTCEGSTLTENGDVVSATGIVIEENVVEGAADSGVNTAEDLESVSSRFARLSVDLIARDVEEEGLYSRAERAEKELREWRRANNTLLLQEVKRWPCQDAVGNFREWNREGHPARRLNLNRERQREQQEEEEEVVEEIEMVAEEADDEYVLEYEFETV